VTLFKRTRERLSFWRWYLTEFRPIAGADGDPDPKPDPAPDPKPDPAPDPKPDPDPSPPAGKTLVDENEFNRLKRIAAEKDAADKKRKREEDEAAGKHNEVVSGLESERDTEKSERERVEGEKADLERSITVRDVANRLKFNDPADALLHLPADTTNDEKAIEKALKKVADEKKYLVGGQGSRTAAPGGGNEPPTPADIDAEIAQAEKDGDVAKSTRLKRQKAFGGKQ